MDDQIKAYSYIRFSTPEQLKGDSLRRQLEASEKYAKEKGLTLDTSLRDLGLSAYHGTHRKKGDLGAFMSLVEKGMIAKGSLLIVENLDRLSREDAMDAFDQFRSIIKAGIKIVTLMDNMSYDSEIIRDNPFQLMGSLMYMIRAHDESERKSQRLKAAWENKRKKAVSENVKLSRQCPYWLKLKKDRSEYELVPEVCECIEKIFRMKLEGKSKTAITRELNQMDVWKPPKVKRNPAGGWREAYVQKLWTSKALIGAYQPLKYGIEIKKENGVEIRKRIKVEASPELENYFPEAIDKQLFYEVQNFIKLNKEQREIKEGKKNNGKGGGNTGKANNLFVNVVKCGLCKNPMHYSNKGKYRYLQCESSQRKLDCTAKSIRYDEFEKLFFANFEELNISDLLPDSSKIQLQLQDIDKQITANKQELKELDNGIENIADTIFTTKDERVRVTLDKRLTTAINKKELINKEIKDLLTEKTELSIEAKSIKQNIDNAKEVYSLLQSAKTEQEQINLRLRLRTEIRKIVSSIEIYPLKEKYEPIEEVESGIYKTMESRYIDRVRIQFRGSRNFRILYLKRFAGVL